MFYDKNRHSPEALANAVMNGYGTQRLQPLGLAGNVTRLSLVQQPGTNHSSTITNNDTNAPTSISLFDQGLVQVLQAAITGLEPKHPYVLALSLNPNGTGTLGPLQQLALSDKYCRIMYHQDT